MQFHQPGTRGETELPWGVLIDPWILSTHYFISTVMHEVYTLDREVRACMHYSFYPVIVGSRKWRRWCVWQRWVWRRGRRWQQFWWRRWDRWPWYWPPTSCLYSSNTVWDSGCTRSSRPRSQSQHQLSCRSCCCPSKGFQPWAQLMKVSFWYVLDREFMWFQSITKWIKKNPSLFPCIQVITSPCARSARRSQKEIGRVMNLVHILQSDICSMRELTSEHI